MTTLFQTNAAAFATTREQREAETLNEISNVADAACKRAIDLYRQGRPGRAAYVLARAAERCSRIAGAGTPRVEPVCPCGGRCLTHWGVA